MAEKPRVITGVVRDNAGKPIAEARIYFTDSPMPLPDIAMLTDSNGDILLYQFRRQENIPLVTTLTGSLQK